MEELCKVSNIPASMTHWKSYATVAHRMHMDAHGALGPTRSGDSWLHNLGQAQGSHSCKLFTMKESLLQIEGHRKCELIIIIWLEAAFLHWEWLDLRVKLAPRLLHHQHKNSHLYYHLLKMCKTSPKLGLLRIYVRVALSTFLSILTLLRSNFGETQLSLETQLLSDGD